jgi:glucuronokinase
VKIVNSRAYARAALLGNPSDGYFGKTLSVIVKNFAAEVVLYEWPELEIILTRQDRCLFDSIDELVEDVKLSGLYGGLRLVKGAIKRFAEYCQGCGIKLPPQNFSLRYHTDIPRQVGLAGSSAIITAVYRALMKFYAVDIPLPILPNLILEVETREIGIAGGLQDRVAQIYEGLVYMDFNRTYLETNGHGRYEPLDPALLPSLYLAYRTDLSEISGIVHSNLRTRWDRGDLDVIMAMKTLADLTDQGKEYLLQRDYASLKELMDRNFDVRARIVNLDPRNVEMVRLARRLGACANYAGSGGSIIGICDSPEIFAQLQTEFARLGCQVLQPRIV